MNVIKFFLKWFGFSCFALSVFLTICVLIDAILEHRNKHT